MLAAICYLKNSLFSDQKITANDSWRHGINRSCWLHCSWSSPTLHSWRTRPLPWAGSEGLVPGKGRLKPALRINMLVTVWGPSTSFWPPYCAQNSGGTEPWTANYKWAYCKFIYLLIRVIWLCMVPTILANSAISFPQEAVRVLLMAIRIWLKIWNVLLIKNILI